MMQMAWLLWRSLPGLEVGTGCCAVLPVGLCCAFLCCSWCFVLVRGAVCRYWLAALHPSAVLPPRVFMTDVQLQWSEGQFSP